MIDKLLFTPGPLTTSAAVKAAMQRDRGSRDADFPSVVRSIRERLLAIGGAVPGGDYECVLMQGSGTFTIESVISSAIPRDGRLLVAVNGAYGRRIAQIARVHGIDVETLDVPENQKISANALSGRLAASSFTHVAVIHCETTTGIVNSVEEIGPVVAAAGAAFIVDAMSSFGAIPLSLEAIHADFLISSANKCIEGVPGFGFILARRDALLAAKDPRERSVSICMRSGPVWNPMASFVSRRPPMCCSRSIKRSTKSMPRAASPGARHVIGVTTRPSPAAWPSWDSNRICPPEDRGYIITTYRYPTEGFRFEEFYTSLSELGFIIYPGKLSQEPCFRIGTIGRLEEKDIHALLNAIGQVMLAMTPRAAAV